jgi:hypothetical protein
MLEMREDFVLNYIAIEGTVLKLNIGAFFALFNNQYPYQRQNSRSSTL